MESQFTPPVTSISPSICHEKYYEVALGLLRGRNSATKWHSDVQSTAFGVSFNLNLQSQSHRSLNGTWQKRPRKLEYRLRFDIEEMTPQMQ